MSGHSGNKVKFPSYVPAGARTYITRTLNGDASGWEGINHFLAEYKSGDAFDDLQREKDCLLRFVKDPRMRDVYATLQKVFTDEVQFAGFLRSAEGANFTDFKPYRDRVHMAKKKLSPQIASAARKLAKLIGEAEKLHLQSYPDEFYSLRVLLDKTDNCERRESDRYIWRAVRGTITGTRREPPTTGAVCVPPKKIVIRTRENARQTLLANPGATITAGAAMRPGKKARIDPREKARHHLRYAWEKAPHLTSILETVAQAANEWRPREHGTIGAAIASRKHNRTMEYLRAFVALLQENLPEVALAGDIVVAMAGIAEVAMGDAAEEVSVVEARKAIEMLDKDSR